jgi:hypothetical protein
MAFFNNIYLKFIKKERKKKNLKFKLILFIFTNYLIDMLNYFKDSSVIFLF